MTNSFAQMAPARQRPVALHLSVRYRGYSGAPALKLQEHWRSKSWLGARRSQASTDCKRAVQTGRTRTEAAFEKPINIDDAIFKLSWRTERNTSLKPCQAFCRLPMASVTRSSRRAEAPHQHHPHHHLTPPAGVFAHAQGGGGGGGRNKRALDTHDRDFDAIKPKRTRLTVEIFAKGTHGLRDSDIDNNKAPPPTRRPAATPTVASATPIPPPPTTDSATSKPKQEQTLTKHQSKVINGIKHELDRLQPQPSDTNTQEQGRKLRSQEATRFKSELSAYFPEYDEVIGNEPKEQRTSKKFPIVHLNVACKIQHFLTLYRIIQC